MEKVKNRYEKHRAFCQGKISKCIARKSDGKTTRLNKLNINIFSTIINNMIETFFYISILSLLTQLTVKSSYVHLGNTLLYKFINTVSWDFNWPSKTHFIWPCVPKKIFYIDKILHSETNFWEILRLNSTHTYYDSFQSSIILTFWSSIWKYIIQVLIECIDKMNNWIYKFVSPICNLNTWHPLCFNNSY